MAARFVGWLGPPRAQRSNAARCLTALLRSQPALQIVRDTPSCLLLAVDLPVTPITDGLVLGRLHPKGGSSACPAGSNLIDDYWGGYVAVIETDRKPALLRAPLGDLPCLWFKTDGGIAFASCPDLVLAAAGAEPLIDWPALARQLAFGSICTAETCLAPLQELRGGDRLTLGAHGPVIDRLWSPWAFARSSSLSAATSDTDLRDLIVTAVAQAMAGHERVLLKLSGGLDSSIVAASLAAAGQDFVCQTLFTDDEEGDERAYARAVAAHLGVRLVEDRRDPGELDLDTSPSAHLTRPFFPGFRQESDRLSAAAAAACGATAVVDGGGGDNVFCSLHAAAAVADCLRDKRGLAALVATAASVASIAQVSVPHVVGRAVLRALSARRRYRWPRDLTFLSPDARAMVPARLDHPWLDAPPGIPPGRAGHVALIAGAQSYVESLDGRRSVPILAPLLAQPVVEHCLAIPSWDWFERGLNRAAARRAFAGVLPAIIVQRRSKGSPECFVAQAFETHRAAIRERLLGGLLAQHGLIDSAAVALALDDRQPALDWSLSRIMTLFDAEIWARQWSC